MVENGCDSNILWVNLTEKKIAIKSPGNARDGKENWREGRLWMAIGRRNEAGG